MITAHLTAVDEIYGPLYSQEVVHVVGFGFENLVPGIGEGGSYAVRFEMQQL